MSTDSLNRVVYVDMDGVLCDFDGHYKNLFRKMPKEHGDGRLWINIAQYGREKFFSELPWLPDGPILWNFIIQNFLNIRICTSMGGNNPSVGFGKRKWLKTHIPALQDKDIIMVTNKHKKQEYSKPGDIIIDDTLVVIQEWALKGGIAIHHKSATETICQLKQYA